MARQFSKWTLDEAMGGTVSLSNDDYSASNAPQNSGVEYRIQGDIVLPLDQPWVVECQPSDIYGVDWVGFGVHCASTLAGVDSTTQISMLGRGNYTVLGEVGSYNGWWITTTILFDPDVNGGTIWFGGDNGWHIGDPATGTQPFANWTNLNAKLPATGGFRLYAQRNSGRTNTFTLNVNTGQRAWDGRSPIPAQYQDNGFSLPQGPVILTQPQPQSVIAGDVAPFSVVVEGDEPVTGPTDEYYNDVTILIHGGGADGASLTTDSVGQDISTSTANGYSNAQSKFSTTSVQANAGQHITAMGSETALGTVFTAEGWHYSADAVTNRTLVDNRIGNSYDMSCYTDTPSGTNYVYINGQYLSLGVQVHPVSQWYHWALVFDDPTWYFYINGALVGQADRATDWGEDPGNGLTFNSPQSGASSSAGFMEEIRFTKGVARYTEAFTPPTAAFPDSGPPVEPDAHIDSVAFILPMEADFDDISANALAMTAVGTPIVDAGESKFGDASGLFNNATPDYLEVVGNSLVAPGTGDFTYETWIYPTDLASSCLVGSSSRSSDGDLYWILSVEASGQAVFQTRSGGGTQYYAKSAVGVVTENNWHHIAATRKAGVVRVFVDGVVGAETSSDGNLNLWKGNLTVGAFLYGVWSSYMHGRMENVRFTNGVARYDADFAVPTAPFPGPGPTYQWREDAVDITGEVARTYDRTTVLADDGLQISVAVTGNGVTTLSDDALLSVESGIPDGPTIDTQPVNQDKKETQTATFSVTATTSGGPLTYQWYESGVGAISGATSASLVLPNLTLADNGKQYYCYVSDDWGTEASTTATLTVSVFGPTFTLQPVSISVDENQPASFTVAGTASEGALSYQWFKGGFLLAGAVNATLSFAAAQVADAGSYTCVLTDDLGSLASDAATLTVIDLAPIIDTDPQDVRGEETGYSTYSVEATPSGGSLTYQWFQVGVGELVAETALNLVVGPLAYPDDIGNQYYVEVTDDNGTTTSGLATQNVRQAPPFFNKTVSQYRDPIFKRGYVTLSRPLVEGEEVIIQRDTAVVSDFTATDGVPFDSENWEYQMDKLTLIAQEIEGNYCDCRLGDSVVPISGVCAEGQCDSWHEYLASASFSYWPMQSEPVAGYVTSFNGLSARYSGPAPLMNDTLWGWPSCNTQNSEMNMDLLGAAEVKLRSASEIPADLCAVITVDKATLGAGVQSLLWDIKKEWSNGTTTVNWDIGFTIDGTTGDIVTVNTQNFDSSVPAGPLGSAAGTQPVVIALVASGVPDSFTVPGNGDGLILTYTLYVDWVEQGTVTMTADVALTDGDYILNTAIESSIVSGAVTGGLAQAAFVPIPADSTELENAAIYVARNQSDYEPPLICTVEDIDPCTEYECGTLEQYGRAFCQAYWPMNDPMFRTGITDGKFHTLTEDPYYDLNAGVVQAGWSGQYKSVTNPTLPEDFNAWPDYCTTEGVPIKQVSQTAAQPGFFPKRAWVGGWGGSGESSTLLAKPPTIEQTGGEIWTTDEAKEWMEYGGRSIARGTPAGAVSGVSLGGIGNGIDSWLVWRDKSFGSRSIYGDSGFGYGDYLSAWCYSAPGHEANYFEVTGYGNTTRQYMPDDFDARIPFTWTAEFSNRGGADIVWIGGLEAIEYWAATTCVLTINGVPYVIGTPPQVVQTWYISLIQPEERTWGGTARNEQAFKIWHNVGGTNGGMAIGADPISWHLAFLQTYADYLPPSNCT